MEKIKIIENVKWMKKLLNNEMLDLLPFDIADQVDDIFDSILKDEQDEKINVIEKDEKIIGTRDELIKKLRHELVYSGADTSIEIETYARIVAETSNVLNELIEYEDNTTVLCLFENPMGSYEFKEIEF